eukprot:24712-Eustigmatos_ZCMA.PRE.1
MAMILLDDLQSLQRVLVSSYFTALVIKHRHVAGGAGVSLLSAVQTYKGLGRVVRQNLTGVMLFKTHDQTALDDAASEC